MSATMKLSSINKANLKPAVTFAVITGDGFAINDVADQVMLTHYFKDKHAHLQMRIADDGLVDLLKDERCPFISFKCGRTAPQEKYLRAQVTFLTKRTKKAKLGFKWLRMATGEWTHDFAIDGKTEARPDDLTLVVIFTPAQAIKAFGSEVASMSSSGKGRCHLGIIATQSPYKRPHKRALQSFHERISEAISKSIGLSTAVEEESSDSEDDESDSSEDEQFGDDEPEVQDNPMTSADNDLDLGGNDAKIIDEEPMTAEEAERHHQMGGYRAPSSAPEDTTAPEEKAGSAEPQSGLPSPPASQSDEAS
jgi:hypothetical protein